MIQLFSYGFAIYARRNGPEFEVINGQNVPERLQKNLFGPVGLIGLLGVKKLLLVQTFFE